MNDLDESNGLDLTPRLDDFSKYKTLEVRLNGVLIRDESIIDLQINYGLDNIGFISFTDSIGIIEVAGLTFSTLEILIEDILGTKQITKYIIIDAKTFRTQNNLITLDLEFELIDTYKLKNSYISKSFKDKNILQIIKDLFTDIGLDAEFNDINKGFSFDYFVTPGNISVYDFIVEQSKISNFKFFIDRFGYVFALRDTFDFSKIPESRENTFSMTNKDPLWRVLEYKGSISNIKETRECVDFYISRPDVNNLQYTPEIIKIKDLYNSQKINQGIGVKNLEVPDVLKTFGYKQINNIYKKDIKGDKRDFREYLQSMQNLTIIVQGILSVRLFSKIKLDIPRVSYNKDDTPDSIFSGNFVVVGVKDKIMAGKFVQLLELKAPDYGLFS